MCVEQVVSVTPGLDYLDTKHQRSTLRTVFSRPSLALATSSPLAQPLLVDI